MEERSGAVTLKGNPLTVMGPALVVGQMAPEFLLVANDLSEVTLADSEGKIRLISVVPSLSTSICTLQTKRFSDEADRLGDRVAVYTVSAEHPWNQRQWCGQEGVSNIAVLSDHRAMSFGSAYGTHIKELRLEQRSVFVIDGEGRIAYLEYVPEIAQYPDFDQVLDAVRALLEE